MQKFKIDDDNDDEASDSGNAENAASEDEAVSD